MGKSRTLYSVLCTVFVQFNAFRITVDGERMMWLRPAQLYVGGDNNNIDGHAGIDNANGAAEQQRLPGPRHRRVGSGEMAKLCGSDDVRPTRE